MPSLFKDPVLVTYIDESDRELVTSGDADVLPRVGENVRIKRVPYLVVRVGYDIPDTAIERIWIVCRPA